MNEDTAPGLTPAQRKALRAQAHHLKPVVMIGDAGLTDAVLAEADRALRIHELIKIRVFGDDRAARDALMEQVCAGLDCAPVQSIGKLLVVYRPRADDEAANGPGAAKRKRRGPHRPKKAAGAKVEARGSAKTVAGAGGRSGVGRKSAASPAARSGTGRKSAASPAARSGTGRKSAASTAARSGTGRKSAASPATRSGTGRKPPTSPTARPSAGRKSAAGAGRAPSPSATTRGTAVKRSSTRAPSAKGIGTRDSLAPVKRSLSEKTAGKRTDIASSSKRPARHGQPSKATQGPPRLQGKSGPRTAGRRNRAKGGG
jgi:RNA-binding protein